MKQFLRDHTSKYEYFSMNNGKYLVWKLSFTRIGDTFVTIDKLLDLMEWQEIYEIMQELTAQFETVTSSQRLICNDRFKLQIYRINDPLRVQCYRRFDVDDVDMNLLHTEAMLVTLSLTENYSDILIEKLGEGKNSSNSSGKNSEGTSMDVTTPKPKTLKTKRSSSSNNSYISLNDEDVIIRKNAKYLQNLMTNEDHLKFYCFEDNIEGGYKFRLFDNVYKVANGSSYVSFHSTKVICRIKKHTYCKLFLCYSDEILKHFDSMTTTFQDIAHILVVFVNMVSDRMTPFGVFLLPSKDELLLDDIIRVIGKWLSKENCGEQTIIATCTTPHDIALHRSIAAQWPKTKLIGCSLEYQNDIKQFAKENRGFRNPNRIQSTRLASVLCYLPQEDFTSGIDFIEKCSSRGSSTDYVNKLVEYLRLNWLNRSISVHDEAIHQRSLAICCQFFKQIEREYFQSGREHIMLPTCKHQNIFEFIEFLRSLFQNGERCMFEVNHRYRFGYNIELQKEKEDRILRAMHQFKENQDAKQAVKDYMFELLNILYK